MNYAPIARIIIRYGVGLVIGQDAANIAAMDPDIETMVAVAIGALTEAVYAYAVKRGWAR